MKWDYIDLWLCHIVVIIVVYHHHHHHHTSSSCIVVLIDIVMYICIHTTYHMIFHLQRCHAQMAQIEGSFIWVDFFPNDSLACDNCTCSCIHHAWIRCQGFKALPFAYQILSNLCSYCWAKGQKLAQYLADPSADVGTQEKNMIIPVHNSGFLSPNFLKVQPFSSISINLSKSTRHEILPSHALLTVSSLGKLHGSLSIKLIITTNLKQEIWVLCCELLLSWNNKPKTTFRATRGTCSFWHESSAHTIRSRGRSNLEDSTKKCNASMSVQWAPNLSAKVQGLEQPLWASWSFQSEMCSWSFKKIYGKHTDCFAVASWLLVWQVCLRHFEIPFKHESKVHKTSQNHICISFFCNALLIKCGM